MLKSGDTERERDREKREGRPTEEVKRERDERSKSLGL